MKARVLVVDDDRLVADTLCLIFRANGFESEARYCAASGFEFAKDFAPALVLCDVVMPDESGLQLAERMREAMPATRLLFLTAYHADGAALQVAAGQVAAGHLPSPLPLKLLKKPCRPDELLRETRLLLQTA